MRGIKLYGIVAAAFMAGVFLASPELRAYASTIANDVICSGCVGTSDLANNAVTSAKIKDGEVKTADLGFAAVTNPKIANSAVNSAKIADGTVTYADLSRSFVKIGQRIDCDCGGTGWDPNGSNRQRIVIEGTVTSELSAIVVSLSGLPAHLCTGIPSPPGHFYVLCDQVIPQGATLNYAIFNP